MGDDAAGAAVQGDLARTLLRAARPRTPTASMTVGELIDNLGSQSFGWCLLLFAMLNLMPMPIGSNMVTALPLICLAVQVALGLDCVRLPQLITRRRLDHRRFRSTVVRARPVIRFLEGLIRPRQGRLLDPMFTRPLGLLLLVFSLALFAPIPLSGFIPAGALFLIALGMVARDSVALLAGIVLGVVAVGITIGVGGAIVAGLNGLV
ncbi:exopolysaccharide biosynthesis protein [Arhodomonas sp. AD133]|uniref:exopolysaccharide biosynthesis protein n=1 Tax=Arhodomonas sp. AD133 TaxID=3415009 RepID=UPI003EBBA3F0